MNKDSLAERLRGLFLIELEDQVRTLNTDLLALEGAPQNAALLASVFRIVHTLKGAAHAAGVPQAENVCHALETMLAHAREGQLELGKAEFSYLFSAADALADAGRRLQAGEDLSGSPLAQLQSSGFDSATRRPPESSRIPTASSSLEGRSALPQEVEPANTAVRDQEQPDSAAIPEPAEKVRVEAEKLDALLASAGELLVATSRVAGRPDQIEQLHERASHCRAGWRRAAHRLRALARQSDDGTAAMETLEEVGRNLQGVIDEAGRLAAASAGDARALHQVVDNVADRVRRLRLRPFSDACAGLPRAVRDLSAASEKKVRLEIEGGDVEADRAVIDTLHEVLLHLVRNAVDHGIESTRQREAAGKPATGTVTVAAALQGHRLQVTVADDGRGLDLSAIRAQLIERGVRVPQGERELVDVLFDPGFTTRREATKTSGRGVGLDAVRTAIERIRGTVQVGWKEGEGTTFALECPPSIATMRAILVRLGTQTLAIPSAHVELLVRVRPEEIRRAEGREVILTAEEPVPLISLARLLGPPLPDPPHTDQLFVVRMRIGGRRLALVVDQLLTEDEIVVRPVERLRNPPAYLGGAAILGTGDVALVLNAASLMSAGQDATIPGLKLEARPPVAPARRRILVVDDSITTRTLEQSILEAEGFDVLTATDGEEGWQLLQEQPVDLVVSDVEMPRRNGFELCRAIRGSGRLSELPIILVTGQEAAEHRQLGLEAGADAYLPKSSFDQQSLLDTIQQLIG